MGLDARKPVFGGRQKQKPDQPAYLGRLISVFVIRYLKSIVSNLVTGEISIFYLVSVAGETGLKLALSETLDRFSCDEALYKSTICNGSMSSKRWASWRENLSFGFQTKRDSNLSAQLQRLARKLKFHS